MRVPRTLSTLFWHAQLARASRNVHRSPLSFIALTGLLSLLSIVRPTIAGGEIKIWLTGASDAVKAYFPQYGAQQIVYMGSYFDDNLAGGHGDGVVDDPDGWDW